MEAIVPGSSQYQPQTDEYRVVSLDALQTLEDELRERFDDLSNSLDQQKSAIEAAARKPSEDPNQQAYDNLLRKTQSSLRPHN